MVVAGLLLVPKKQGPDRKFTVFGSPPKIFGSGGTVINDVRKTLCKQLPKKKRSLAAEKVFWGV